MRLPWGVAPLALELQLSEEVKREWMQLQTQKSKVLEERDAAREGVKQRFADFCVRNAGAVTAR